MCCIKKGQLNPAARREVIQVVSSRIMDICKYPTTAQLNVVASKIAEELGAKDLLGVGYVSKAYFTC